MKKSYLVIYFTDNGEFDYLKVEQYTKAEMGELLSDWDNDQVIYIPLNKVLKAMEKNENDERKRNKR